VREGKAKKRNTRVQKGEEEEEWKEEKVTMSIHLAKAIILNIRVVICGKRCLKPFTPL
jgi:hypothetical protein